VHIRIEVDQPEMMIKISDLSIQESYFVGHCKLDGKEYSLNIQNQSGGKIIKLPFRFSNETVLTKISGKNIKIQDELQFKGKSEWIEIYSDTITKYLADHQEGSEWLEITDS
jgi:hypothetical protein